MTKSALLVSPEPIGKTLTGLGKRAEQLRQLLLHLGYQTEVLENRVLSSLKQSYRFCIANVFDVATSLTIQNLKIPVITDLYTPFFLENIPQNRDETDLRLLKSAVENSHGYICAPGRQYDMYFGILYALGGINYAKRLHPLPFFLEPQICKPSIEQIRHIAWIGGFWEWFYPEPFLCSVREILFQHPDVHISFVGIEHPRIAPNGYNFKALQQAQKLSLEFSDRVKILPWLSSPQYSSFLNSVDLAIVQHRNDYEATYCIRTRYCELLEQQIPMITSSGGYFEPYIKSGNLGLCVDDSTALKNCLEKIILNGFPNRSYAEIYREHKKENIAEQFGVYLNHVLSTKPLLKKGSFSESPLVRFGRKMSRLVRKLRTESRPDTNPESFSPRPDEWHPR